VLNEDVLRGALSGAELPDGSVYYAEELESTNATALELAAGGAPEWTLVAAERQTAGRGRLGRRWETPPAGGLLFSLVLRPTSAPDATPILTLLAGWAMALACTNHKPRIAVRCKWPNDLLLEGAKVGGVLAEARVTGGHLDHLVLGIGVNLGIPPPVEGAGALPFSDPLDLLDDFLFEFGRTYRWPGRQGLTAKTIRRYRPVCATLGRRVRARTIGGAAVEGVAEDLDTSGNLLVRTETGLETVGFGEVEHLR
jgi:BirA family biotin operon repressor/biotin-[acetyl-CoA-carboxylase] ligase